MSKIAVLAEKPSVGRDLARVLGCGKQGNGYLEGNAYIVTWALGHLVTLADPELYDDKYKTWELAHLPMLPEPLQLVVIKQTGKQYKTVREVLTRKDVKEIVIATDAGREGELVARWILEKAKISKPLKRLWISSVTDKAIKAGFANLKNAAQFERLYDSAAARSEADWLVGLNGTRALTAKYNAQLSCGRVQTPTLAMVAHRETEIRKFTPKPYYGLTAQTKDGYKLIWRDSKTGEARTFDPTKRDGVHDELQRNGSANKAVIEDVQKNHKKVFPPQLYNLTELQRDANKIYGFSAKETLSIMQKLYEQHKYLTYPRTDSRYLSSDIVDTLAERLRSCAVGHYQRLAGVLLRSSIKVGKQVVDDSRVSDHHAIIPTEETVFLHTLSDKERKIYDLVVKRFLAVMYPAYEYEQMTVTVKIGDQQFFAKGKTEIRKGWKEIYGDSRETAEIGDMDEAGNPGEVDRNREAESYQLLPSLQRGNTIQIANFTKTAGQTLPPPYFTEASLLSAMENPRQYMQTTNRELIKTIGEAGGLGTVATRADILEKLFNSFLLEKRGKEIHMTAKGRQLLQLVPDDLKSPELTAVWEQKLTAISQGNMAKKTFVSEMREYAKKIVRDIKEDTQVFKHDNISRQKCPECGKFLLEVNGKKGKMLVCEERECRFRKSVSKSTNARCPECMKKMELKGVGDKQVFTCQCGYRERLAAFEERRKQRGTKVSKQETSKFIKELNKEAEPVNTALADALAKLKFD